jgi:aspartate aminotransferase
MIGLRLIDARLDERVSELAHSPALAAHERANHLAADGGRVFKLDLGQSPFPAPAVVVDALRAHAARDEYAPVGGLPELRRAVADFHRRRYGTARGEKDVLVGPGSKELTFLLLYSFAGELLVPTPAWPPYVPQARLTGRALRLLPTRASHQYRLDPDSLEDVAREAPRGRRMLVLSYPGNPTGATYSATELFEIAEICRRRDILVLSDERYGELQYNGQHLSIAPLYDEGAIVSTGLSKWCGGEGYRLGTLSFPSRLGWLAQAMAALASETFSGTSTPLQYAAARAFRGGLEIEEYLSRARRVLCGLTSWGAGLLRGAGIEVVEPAGGFYLFAGFERLRTRLRVRGIGTDVELAARLLQDVGVSALPGSLFGMPEDALQLRLALVDFDGAKALVAADDEVDKAFVCRYCGPTYEALQSVRAWVENP